MRFSVCGFVSGHVILNIIARLSCYLHKPQCNTQPKRTHTHKRAHEYAHTHAHTHAHTYSHTLKDATHQKLPSKRQRRTYARVEPRSTRCAVLTEGRTSPWRRPAEHSSSARRRFPPWPCRAPQKPPACGRAATITTPPGPLGRVANSYRAPGGPVARPVAQPKVTNRPGW